ncbi:spore coat assemly protein [Pelagirhabdus alkalitolerans]|uniref:Spore coat assemly protein n=2 Tax=Pelagirhabdus alkalitolerans TaxID=1612202 RepID=A0A1G6MJV0_9BACI|nr:spore coat assemly protein [Pelagirhabdus alkalitolerans]
MIVKGDLVTRRSYQHDILFRVQMIEQDEAILFGEDIRLEADAPIDDLIKVDETLKERFDQREEDQQAYSYRLFKQDYQLMKEQNKPDPIIEHEIHPHSFQIPAKVLHLDGDKQYLKKCIELYKKLDIHVQGLYIEEENMPLEITSLIKRIQPNIIVITGHDAYSEKKGKKRELKAYRNTRYFVEAVRKARELEPNLDQLIVFAGACQSHFQSLIRAGANFASSPSRVNIHALDPVYIVAKLTHTSFMDKVTIEEALKHTRSKEEGIGGVETRGCLRVGRPFIENLVD